MIEVETPEANFRMRILKEKLEKLILQFAMYRKGIKPSDLHELGIQSYGCNFLPTQLLKELVNKGLVYQKVVRGKYYVTKECKLDAEKVTYNDVQKIFVQLLELVFSRFKRQKRTSTDVRRLFGNQRSFVGHLITILKRKKCLAGGVRRELFPSGTVTNNTPYKSGRGKSHGEQMVEFVLNKLDIPFEAEVCPTPFGRLRLDFLIEVSGEKIIVEFDGIQHRKPVKHFGGEKAFKKTQERDKLKNKIAYDKGYHMLRLSSDTQKCSAHVLGTIKGFLKEVDQANCILFKEV